MCITTTYFGSVSRAKKWFAQNNIVLDAKPIELCSTAQGIKQIENSIMRLTHGMTA
ncbi:MbcA/ParS/Xre antitoxin family protein [uncultured Paraglaciecola sp.]|uniref:MbcA/ParS/Xre antitoxin family protein n=1 Tax=uncultured Paraglaciecola sp. TaxID=1765024 RepID=UPI003416B919